MITEIVLFRLPETMSREDAMAKYRLSVPIWKANPDLIRKGFLYDAASRRGGGVYLLKNLEAAKRGHGPEFQERIRSTFGAHPEFQYFETPIVIDNAAHFFPFRLHLEADPVNDGAKLLPEFGGDFTTMPPVPSGYGSP